MICLAYQFQSIGTSYGGFRTPAWPVPRKSEPGARGVAIDDLALETWPYSAALHRGPARCKGRDGTPPLEGRVASPWKRIREGKSVVAVFGKCHLPPSPKWGPGV